MESTLLVGDFLLVNKQTATNPSDGSDGLLPSSAIHRGDIVVFHDPVDSTLHLVKRVIGLPGDRLRLHSGRVFINGHQLDRALRHLPPQPAGQLPRQLPPPPERRPGDRLALVDSHAQSDR